MNLLPTLFLAHLAGDFLLQNEWMQAKTRSTFVCTVHVLAYALPFVPLAVLGPLAAWQLAAILVQHWLQDRFALHLVWMRLYRQTPSHRWPAGPLCVDQALHLVWIGLVVWLGTLLT